MSKLPVVQTLLGGICLAEAIARTQHQKQTDVKRKSDSDLLPSKLRGISKVSESRFMQCTTGEMTFSLEDEGEGGRACGADAAREGHGRILNLHVHVHMRHPAQGRRLRANKRAFQIIGSVQCGRNCQGKQ